VLGDGLACDRQTHRELADGGWAFGGEGGEDRAARRVGQSDEDLFGHSLDVR
jgi:hypothetical protein